MIPTKNQPKEYRIKNTIKVCSIKLINSQKNNFSIRWQTNPSRLKTEEKELTKNQIETRWLGK